MPNIWAIDAHHVVPECPPNGHRQTNQWTDFQEISVATSNDINMTFPDFSRHFFTLSTRKGRHYQFHKTEIVDTCLSDKTEIVDTCHYLDLSQQSNTINNKTKKKFGSGEIIRG